VNGLIMDNINQTNNTKTSAKGHERDGEGRGDSQTLRSGSSGYELGDGIENDSDVEDHVSGRDPGEGQPGLGVKKRKKKRKKKNHKPAN
jgi:hypothetical protein